MRRRARSSPDLAQKSRNPWPGNVRYAGYGAFWSAQTKALHDWLGAYTPACVPVWILKLMRRDPDIRLGLSAIKGPFFGLEYRAEGGEPRTRAFLEQTLLRPALLDKLLWAILLAVDYGWSASEILWRIEDVEIDADGVGGEPARKMPRAFVPRDIFDQDPETTGVLVDEQGNLVGVQAMAGGGGFIPAEKLVFATHQFEHRNWLGDGDLPCAYIPWFKSNWLLLYMMRAAEARGIPPYRGRAPGKLYYDNAKGRESQTPRTGLEILASALMELRSAGVCMLPSDVDENGKPLFDVDVLGQVNSGEQFLPLLQFLKREKMHALLLPDLAVTQDTSTGSFAMADVHVDMFFNGLEVKRRTLVLRALNDLAALLQTVNYGAPGRGVRHAQIASGDFARQSRVLMAEFMKASLTQPRRLADGRTYTIAEQMDTTRMLRGLNVPILKPEEVAAPATAAATPEAKVLQAIGLSMRGADPSGLTVADAKAWRAFVRKVGNKAA